MISRSSSGASTTTSAAFNAPSAAASRSARAKARPSPTESPDQASFLAASLILVFEVSADLLQLSLAVGRELWEGDVEAGERLKDHFGDDQPGVLLVVSGHDVPGRFVGTGLGQTVGVSGHVVRPEL